jgi:hypothetical protein
MHEISLAQGIIKTAEDTLKQENAKAWSAYDTKNLCVYLDDSYGIAIAISIMIVFL